MRLRHPLAIRFSALALSGLLRGYLGTLDHRFVLMDPAASPMQKRSMMYLFWHEWVLMPAYANAGAKVTALISRHSDGELMAQVLQLMNGLASIRGSTNRGGVPALRQLMRAGKATHLAIVPDGPRGPRRVVQSGSVYLASRNALPIVPVGMAFRRPWRLPSWDKMAWPKPFTAAREVFGHPIEVPPGLDRDALDHYTQVVQREMDKVQALAEDLAERRVISGTISLSRFRTGARPGPVLKQV